MGNKREMNTDEFLHSAGSSPNDASNRSVY